jgi:hypothetical protein
MIAFKKQEPQGARDNIEQAKPPQRTPDGIEHHYQEIKLVISLIFRFYPDSAETCYISILMFYDFTFI